jgi:hypothetical protein
MNAGLVPRRWRLRLVGRVSAPLLLASVLALVPAGSVTAGGQAKGVLPRSPLSGGVLMAQAIRSGAVKLPAARDAVVRSGSIGRPPLPDVQASAGNQPVNENPMAANPANGLQLATGGNDYNCTTIQGFYQSDDGGATWRQHCLPQVGAGGCGDPITGYDQTGKLWIGGIGNCSGFSGSIVVQSSTDNGLTWGPMQTAVPPFFAGGLADKPWLEVDNNAASPFAGSLYISVTQFESNLFDDQITVTYSRNGTTWTTVAVGPHNTYPAVSQFSDLAVGDDGTVYLTYMQCTANGPAGDCGNTIATFYFSKSTDGGVNWSAPAPMFTARLTPDIAGCFYGCVPTTSERTSDIPAIDVTDSGDLYVVSYNYTGTFMQTQVSKSTNGGSTWSAPAPVNPSLTADQFLPWLSVNPVTGNIGVDYLRRQGGQYRPFVAASNNGGAAWINRRITSATSRFSDDGFGGFFMGDYTGNIWVNDKLYVAWIDTRLGRGADFVGGWDF